MKTSLNDIETVLLSTHNLCFDREIRKLFIDYTPLSKGTGVIKLFFMLNSAEQEIYPALKC